MGCDIHLYIEHKTKEINRWWCFGKRINPGRDYRIFAKLCGVRNYYEELVPITTPRGLPETISYVAKDDNEIYVSDTENNEGWVTKEKAEKWVELGISRYTNDKKNFVTNPDWHSHSWATTKELEQVFANEDNIDNEWKVVLEIMKAFERLGEEVRIVFWFDN